MFSNEARAKLKKVASGLKNDDFEMMSLKNRNEYIIKKGNLLPLLLTCSLHTL